MNSVPFNKALFIVSMILTVVGCVIAGIAVLAGGGDALVLPDFLQGTIG